MANFLGILKQELNLMTCHLALMFNMAWRIRKSPSSAWRYTEAPSIYGQQWRIVRGLTRGIYRGVY